MVYTHVALIWVLSVVNIEASSKRPVVFVPGYYGSQLEAQLNKTSGPKFWCSRRLNYFTIWLEPLNLAPLLMDCWMDNMRLVYDIKTRRTQNSPGVSIRPRLFGSTDALRFLSSLEIPLTKYYHNLIEMLINEGYQNNVALKGAPYDWRRAPYENEEFISQLKQLLENSYKENDNQSAVIICHSYGCPYIHYFLIKQSQAWKDTYVKALVGVAGAWAGVWRSMFVYLDIYDFEDMPSSLFPRMRSVERTFSSNTYLFPTSEVYGNDVLVQTPTKNYTANNYDQYFRDMNDETGLNMRLNAEQASARMDQHPGTDVYCVSGTGLKTREGIVLSSDSLTEPKVERDVYGDGDGRLGIKSMRSCLLWKENKSGHKFEYKELQMNHMQLIQEKAALDHIHAILRSIQ